MGVDERSVLYSAIRATIPGITAANFASGRVTFDAVRSRS